MAKKKTSSVISLRDHKKVAGSDDTSTIRAANTLEDLATGGSLKRPIPDANTWETPMRPARGKATPLPEALDHTVQSAISRFTHGL
jgi:hypothetical protein